MKKLVVSPVAAAAVVLTALWLILALVGVFRAHDLWGWLWTAFFGVAAIVSAALAGTLTFRLLPGQVKPVVGKGVAWAQIEGVAVRKLPLGLASVQVDVSRGRSLARRDLDILGTAGWVTRMSAELAARAGVDVTEAPREPPRSSQGGRIAE